MILKIQLTFVICQAICTKYVGYILILQVITKIYNRRPQNILITTLKKFEFEIFTMLVSYLRAYGGSTFFFLQKIKLILAFTLKLRVYTIR